MRIGIDARFYNESGVGRYLRNLISNLKVLDKKNEYFIFLLPRDLAVFKETGNFKKVIADFPWYGFAEQLKFPNLLNKFKLDIVHFPHFNVPIFYKGKFVVTIHDLIHQHFQMKRVTTLNPILYSLKQLGYRKVFKQALLKSGKIIVPSKYVADLLINKWNVSGKKITVTHEAVDQVLLRLVNNITKDKSNRIMKKFKIEYTYIFYVGNAHPHKNVEGLIRVFKKLKEKYQYFQLVLAGEDHYFWQRIKKDYQYKDIKFIGKVTDEELAALYKNARVFVQPSFEEGFGIPILEAMACGVPVVCSKEGSLSEVAADAAIYFDPGNATDMINKIDTVLRVENLRYDLIKKGYKRIELFSWHKMARQTLEVYNQCF